MASSTMASAPQPAKKNKGKKTADPSEQQKQIQAKIAQLELDAAGDKEQELEIEREVKKANRELSSLLSNMDGPLSRLEVVQKRYTELLSDMKRTEREHQKAKKRGDQLQKEKDAQRAELNKVTTIKDKLDKLSRDFAKENKKLKDELHKLETSESTARHELHERLENLVADVDDCIAAQAGPEPQNQAQVELDELYVSTSPGDSYADPPDSGKNSNPSSTSTNSASCSSTPSYAPRSSKYSTKWPVSSSNASSRRPSRPSRTS
jgi:chromosome segregation ATPase